VRDGPLVTRTEREMRACDRPSLIALDTAQQTYVLVTIFSGTRFVSRFAGPKRLGGRGSL
jgi:hypothetical protein